MRRIAECEIVTVVFVIRRETVGIDRRGREIGLVLVRAALQREGVGVDVSRLEEVIIRRVVVTPGIREAFAPAMDRRTRGLALAARAVPCLEFRHPQRREKLRVARKRYFQFARFAFLRGDEHCTVRGIRTVEGRSRGARHNGHRSDIVGVQIRDGFRSAARVELHTSFGRVVEHRDAVHHIQRIRGLHDGFHAAHGDLRGTAHARRGLIDDRSRDLAGQGVDEVGILDHRDIFGRDLCHGVGQRLLRTFDAEGRYHYGIYLLGSLFEYHAELRAGADFEVLRSIAQKVDRKTGRRGRRYAEAETALGVRRGADRRARDEHRGADDGTPARIDDEARHCGRLFLRTLRQEDRRRGIQKRIGVGGGREQTVEDGFQRFVFGIHRNRIFDVDLDIGNEAIRGLSFYFAHSLLQRRLFQVQVQTRCLSLARKGDAQQKRRERKRKIRTDLRNTLFIHTFVD